MADYQSVEIGTSDGVGEAYSPEDLQKIEEMNQSEQEAPAEAQEQFDEERPAWLPEKFGSPEEMAKAYEELQSQFTKDRQEGSEDANEQAQGDLTPLSTNDFAEFNDEFAQTGGISEESISKIEGWGIPREMIEGYIEGQKALLDTHYNTIYSEVGGEENYGEMLSWAAETLPEGEQDAFNRAVMQGTPDEMMFAVRSLAGRWMSSEGRPSAPLVQGSTSAVGASGGFRSVGEVTAAMRDPRYQKDAAYRRDVEQRLANSSVI